MRRSAGGRRRSEAWVVYMYMIGGVRRIGIDLVEWLEGNVVLNIGTLKLVW